MSSKIIQPLGKIVRTIQIDCDVQGRTRIKAEAINPLNGMRGPFPAIELAAILSQAATAQVLAIIQRAVPTVQTEDTHANQETEKESDGRPH